MRPKLITSSMTPRGLSGGAETSAGSRWRPTRLETSDKATLTRAVVEEVRGHGWRWNAWRGTVLIGVGGLLERLSKDQAIEAAMRAMRGEAS